MYKDSEGNWVPVPKPVPLYHVIRGALLNALAYTDGHQGKAGALLGLSQRQMCYTLQTYNVPSKFKSNDKPVRKRHALRLVR